MRPRNIVTIQSQTFHLGCRSARGNAAALMFGVLAHEKWQPIREHSNAMH
jgi:hypothetical protein